MRRLPRTASMRYLLSACGITSFSSAVSPFSFAHPHHHAQYAQASPTIIGLITPPRDERVHRLLGAAFLQPFVLVAARAMQQIQHRIFARVLLVGVGQIDRVLCNRARSPPSGTSPGTPRRLGPSAQAARYRTTNRKIASAFSSPLERSLQVPKYQSAAANRALLSGAKVLVHLTLATLAVRAGRWHVPRWFSMTSNMRSTGAPARWQLQRNAGGASGAAAG